MEAAPRASAFLRARVQPRAFRLYSVGAPKTGTLSIANLLRPAHRSVHEARYVEAIDHLVARRAGAASDTELADWLRRRDTLVWAECESSHVLCWFCDLIPHVFPESRFVVTVRDCYSWTNSVIDQHLNNRPSPLARRLRDVYYGEKSTDPQSVLTDHGEYTLGGYVSYWASHYEFLLEYLPRDRTLFLPTKRIGERAAEIAAFAGVPVRTLTVGRAHSHVAPQKHDLLGVLGSETVHAAISSRCRATAERLARLPGLDGMDLMGLRDSP